MDTAPASPAAETAASPVSACARGAAPQKPTHAQLLTELHAMGA